MNLNNALAATGFYSLFNGSKFGIFPHVFPQ